MPKIIVWAMLKRREKKRKISMPKGMREKKKMHAKLHEEKKKKKKEIKVAHTFK